MSTVTITSAKGVERSFDFSIRSLLEGEARVPGLNFMREIVNVQTRPSFTAMDRVLKGFGYSLEEFDADGFTVEDFKEVMAGFDGMSLFQMPSTTSDTPGQGPSSTSLAARD